MIYTDPNGCAFCGSTTDHRDGCTGRPQHPTVPVAPSGLEGWSSCCGAAVTFSDVSLCCKGCWREVATLYLDAERGDRLGAIVRGVITGAMTADEGVAAQRELLGWPA